MSLVHNEINSVNNGCTVNIIVLCELDSAYKGCPEKKLMTKCVKARLGDFSV